MKHSKSLAVSAAAILCSLTAGEAPLAAQALSSSARLIHTYTLPSYSLLNLGYSQAELDAAQANGLTTTDHPAIGSGLQRLNGNHYIAITDRGPNADRPDGATKAFPMPQYTPTIMLFKTVNDQIVPEAVLPIVNDLGHGVTGIPNGPTEDGVPYLTLTSTDPLPFNPDGMDVEDVHTLPGGGFIITEEYGPSIAIVSDTGHVLKRYIPAGKSLAANYQVSPTLPPVLALRRGNRGFEALAVSDDGKTAYTMTQSPMLSASRLLRVFRFDISNPLDLRVTGEFVFLMQPASEFIPTIAQKDLKVSGAAWISQDKLLVVQNSDGAPAKLVSLDLTAATDVKDLASALAVPLVLENPVTDLANLGITPGKTTVLSDFGTELPAITERKLEGLSILNANQIAISNDNDFGIGANPNSVSTVYVIQLASPLR